MDTVLGAPVTKCTHRFVWTTILSCFPTHQALDLDWYVTFGENATHLIRSSPYLCTDLFEYSLLYDSPGLFQYILEQDDVSIEQCLQNIANRGSAPRCLAYAIATLQERESPQLPLYLNTALHQCHTTTLQYLVQKRELYPVIPMLTKPTAIFIQCFQSNPALCMFALQLFAGTVYLPADAIAARLVSTHLECASPLHTRVVAKLCDQLEHTAHPKLWVVLRGIYVPSTLRACLEAGSSQILTATDIIWCVQKLILHQCDDSVRHVLAWSGVDNIPFDADCVQSVLQRGTGVDVLSCINIDCSNAATLYRLTIAHVPDPGHVELLITKYWKQCDRLLNDTQAVEVLRTLLTRTYDTPMSLLHAVCADCTVHIRCPTQRMDLMRNMIHAKKARLFSVVLGYWHTEEICRCLYVHSLHSSSYQLIKVTLKVMVQNGYHLTDHEKELTLRCQVRFSIEQQNTIKKAMTYV